MTLAHMISGAFPGGADCLCSPDDIPVARLGRRRKLWELPHAYHCALIGTCLPVADMRRLAPHSGYDVSKMTDYSLHTVVVGYCEKRDALTEAIQRFLDKRHAAAIALFAPAADTAAIGILWREVLARGDDIPGALWAAWTHPAMDDELGRDVHGDIHMLSHQAGAAVRADLRQMERHKDEAARLRDEVKAMARVIAEAREAHERELATLHPELAAARRRAANEQRLELELAAARSELKELAALRQRAAALATRTALLEEWNTGNARRAAQLELDLADARAELAAAEDALASALGVHEEAQDMAGCRQDCPIEAQLVGRCILCVGGRNGLVDGYRKVVEHRGGRFLHHDGGQEEHLHRIDAAIANADAVVCQAGCVSQAAYWRLKEACKKLGKPCVFVQSPGVGSFARSLAALANAAPTDQFIRISA